jgi:hypothetical protein
MIDMELSLRTMRRTLPLSCAELKRLSDEELMYALQAGCHDALAVLFDRSNCVVFGFVFKFLPDTAEAEDVLHSSFLDPFSEIAQFDASKSSAER